MRNLLLWYLPQAAFFCFGFWAAMDRPDMNIAGAAIGGAIFAAAYTGGANLVISIASRLRRHSSKPSADRERLVSGGRLLSERAQ